MSVLKSLSTAFCLAIFLYIPVAAAADLRDNSKAQTARYRHLKKTGSAQLHKAQVAIKNTDSFLQTTPEASNVTPNSTWGTHALPKGNWVFTRYGIHGTYPDNYP